MKEIKEAIENNNAGMSCDLNNWSRILDIKKWINQFYF